MAVLILRYLAVRRDNMASPEVLDFDRILAPIPGDNPAGRPLRADSSYDSIYSQIKGARETARRAERSMVFEDDAPQKAGGSPEWKTVLDLAPGALAEESKDLELSAWLTEALVRIHGYAGLRDGFRLMRLLVERFWDGLYPLPDEEGLVSRLAPLAGLNGEESDGVLVRPILNVPITAAGDLRALSYSDYQQAADLEAVSDPDKRAQRIARGAITHQVFEQAAQATPTDVLAGALDDLTAAREEFDQLSALLEEKSGLDETGHSLAPPSSNLRGAMESCGDLLKNLSQGRLPPPETAEEQAAGETPGTAATSVAGGPIRGREEAFRLLLQVADFFKRTEPHSPISYALEQAVRWGRLPLPALLAELIPEEAARLQLFKLVGIPPPDKTT
jgi:type VI secretion system protein ImpA